MRAKYRASAFLHLLRKYACLSAAVKVIILLKDTAQSCGFILASGGWRIRAGRF
jgi:hypothetical protein